MAHVLGDWRQREKLSEVKPTLKLHRLNDFIAGSVSSKFDGLRRLKITWSSNLSTKYTAFYFIIVSIGKSPSIESSCYVKSNTLQCREVVFRQNTPETETR